MDLERFIQPPPLGEVELESPRPLLEQTVQNVVDDSVRFEPTVDPRLQELIDFVFSLVPESRPDFHIPPSDGYLDELVERLVDASQLSDEDYVQVMRSLRQEVASSVLRAFTLQYGFLFGVQYDPPVSVSGGVTRAAVRHPDVVSEQSDLVVREPEEVERVGSVERTDAARSPLWDDAGRYTDEVREALSHFLRRVSASVSAPALGGLVQEFLYESYSEVMRAWDELRMEVSSFREEELPKDPKERQLEERVRDLERNFTRYCQRAYEVGSELSRLSPQVAAQILVVVDQLIRLLELSSLGADLFLGMAAIRIRVDFKHLGNVLKNRFERVVKGEISNVMHSAGRAVLQPMMGQVIRLQQYKESLQRLVGALPELDLLQHVLDKFREWEGRYYDYAQSMRSGVVESMDGVVQVTKQVVGYSNLRRRRRLNEVMLRLLRCLRRGLTEAPGG